MVSEIYSTQAIALGLAAQLEACPPVLVLIRRHVRVHEERLRISMVSPVDARLIDRSIDARISALA